MLAALAEVEALVPVEWEARVEYDDVEALPAGDDLQRAFRPPGPAPGPDGIDSFPG